MLKMIRLAALLLVVALVLPLVFSIVETNKVDATPSECWNTVYVDASRPDDTGNGLSWATAKMHIQSGIDIVCTGGTVYVALGTYNEHLHIGHSCNLSGAGAPTTIIDGGGAGQVIYIASYVGQANTISGFTIQNGHIGGTAAPMEGAFPVAGPGMPVGGGVYVAPGNVVILNDCTIRNNTANFMGGGVYNAGELTLNRCTVSGNTAYMVGGGIANFVDESYAAGAGIDVLNGKMTLINCTISGNSVKETSVVPATDNVDIIGVLPLSLSLGGGVYNGGVADFINVTIANNSVPVRLLNTSGFVSNMFHGAGFANVPLQCGNENLTIVHTPVATFTNTLVADNVPDNGYNNEGIVTSLGFNLDSQDTCGFHQPTDQVNADPLLGPLQNNGGPTSTHAIPASSPAYNRGTSAGAPATDQRGVTRPQAGAYDIGAYELLYISPTPLPPPPPTTETNPLIGTGGQSSSPGLAVGSYGYSPPVSLPIIQTQSASLSAKSVTPGTPVTVTADITNKSTVNGSKKVTLYVNGQIETTQGVTVSSGGSSKLTFSVSRSDPGDYSVYVDGVPAGSFKVELFRESDGILVVSVALLALAFLIGMVMLWRRQRTG